MASSAARAIGASSSTIPRLVLDRVQRRVASIARRTVVPEGPFTGAGQGAGPIATALARKSSYRVSWKWCSRRDISRLRRAHLEQAGELSCGRHVRR